MEKMKNLYKLAKDHKKITIAVVVVVIMIVALVN